MPKLIRLRPHHTDTIDVDHPLLNDSVVYNEEELNALAAQAAEDTSKREVLLMALRSCLGNNVGRYMRRWIIVRRFKDEMVSEGFLALSALMNELSLEFLSGRCILTIASRRIQEKIQLFLNANLATTSPSWWKQRELVKEGEEPLYHAGSNIDDVPESFHPSDAGDEWKRDFLQVFNNITKDRIDEAILDNFNWGATHRFMRCDIYPGNDQVRYSA